MIRIRISTYYCLFQKKERNKNRWSKKLRGLKTCVSKMKMIDSSSSFIKIKLKNKEKYLDIKVKNPSQLSHEKEFQCINTITENVLQLQSPRPLFCSPVFENRGYNQLFPISCIRSTFSSLFYDQLFPPPLPPPSPLCEEKTGRGGQTREVLINETGVT